MIALLVVAALGQPVTNRDYFMFVRANPTWAKDRASSLVVDGNYLAHWAAPDRLGERALPAAPVVDVSWFAARAYCAWRGGRLPLASEAAAAPDLAWYEEPQPDIVPVHARVWEWSEDFGATMPTTTCGAAQQGDSSAYTEFLRAAFFGSLEATYTIGSLGFRCIYDGAPAPALRGNVTSLYDLPLPALRAGRGHVTLVSMFYASCPAACPILIGELQQILDELGDRDVHVVLVSFDPDHDTPAMLKALAEARHLDARWSLSAGGDTRLLAAALGYRYQKTASGAFSHTVAVVALDPEGRPIARMDRLGDHEAFTRVVAAATARPSTSSAGSGAGRPARSPHR